MKKVSHKIIGISPVSIRACKLIFHVLNYFLTSLILEKSNIIRIYLVFFMYFS